ncbi:MoaD/ThiS family protein [Gimesia fumaroli]|uniref:Sulfur carrier protein CysO n=1 Tax=Gimesia fumaroli TaxID=2527976 RepID=A0A518I8H4_9PLAN|nr:MoaD/ThiS family protein [Gimesia fumaroli]QDV49398.1 Sulfur carrier protein CysO [Gimesia fumaroli]
MPRLFIPPSLRPFCEGEEEVNVEGATVLEAVQSLDQQYPGVMERLCPEGKLRAGIAVTVDQNVTPRGLAQKVSSDSEIHFLPAIGGG